MSQYYFPEPETTGYINVESRRHNWTNKNTAIETIKNEPFSFADAPDRFKRDRDVVAVAIRLDPLLLKYASSELKNDWILVLAAVTRNGLAIQYASPELRDDLDLARVAVHNNPRAFIHLSSRLREDDELIELAVRRSGSSSISAYASPRFRIPKQPSDFPEPEVTSSLDF